MAVIIICIPADTVGNKLWLKNFRVDKDRYFIKYKSTYNDIPFIETEIYIVDNSAVITGDNGIVLWRFDLSWLQRLIDLSNPVMKEDDQSVNTNTNNNEDNSNGTSEFS